MKIPNNAIVNQIVKWFRRELKPYIEKYNAFEPKKRSQILLGGLVFSMMFIQAILLAPIQSSTTELTGKTTKLNALTQQNRSTSSNILTQVQQSIANPRSAESVKLMQQIEGLNKGLAVYYEATVAPSEMGDVLREMLSQDKKLSFISMKSLPTVEVLGEKPEFSEFTKIEKRPKLYKRGVEIIFRGTYESTFSYLERLETYRKKIFWDHLIYKVKEYPIAEVTMRVYTLSDEESWIGS